MKVSIIGAGKVGSQLGKKLVLNDYLEEIIFLDIDIGAAKGTALDINHLKSLKNISSKVIGTSDYEKIKGSDIVVISAGAPRKEDDSRNDLLERNIKIIRDIVEKAIEVAPNAIYINVTNPVDVLTWVIYNETNLSRKKVVGMAGALDSSRFCYYVSKKINLPPSQINGLVIGSHSSKMVPLPNKTSINGIPCKEFLSEKEVEKAIKETKKAGKTIIDHKNTSAYFAPASALEEMIESILFDKKKIFTASVILKGEYGLNNLSIGTPIVLGKKGVNKVIELDLGEENKKKFHESAKKLLNQIKKLKN